MDEIPSELIINFDQMGINYVPVSLWRGSKKDLNNRTVGEDDKWQITTFSL